MLLELWQILLMLIVCLWWKLSLEINFNKCHLSVAVRFREPLFNRASELMTWFLKLCTSLFFPHMATRLSSIIIYWKNKNTIISWLERRLMKGHNWNRRKTRFLISSSEVVKLAFLVEATVSAAIKSSFSWHGLVAAFGTSSALNFQGKWEYTFYLITFFNDWGTMPYFCSNLGKVFQGL